MKLLNVTVQPHGAVVARYEATHCTPGRDGTMFTFEVELSCQGEETSASIVLGHASAMTTDAAIRRLAEWCERAAVALRSLKVPTNALPLYP